MTPWTTVASDSHDALHNDKTSSSSTILSYKEEGEIVSIKVSTFIKAPLDVIFQHIIDYKHRLLWDKLTDAAEVKVVIDKQNDIVWYEY